MITIFLTKTKEPKAFTTREGAKIALEAAIAEVELPFEDGGYPSEIYMATDAAGTQFISEKIADLVAWSGGNPIRIAIVPLIYTNEYVDAAA